MKVRKRPRGCRVAVLCLVVGMAAPAAWAKETETGKNEPSSDVAVTLPEVVVSAKRSHAYEGESRTEVSSDATALPAPTTVMDAAAIQRTPTLSYVDLFRSVPGVNIDNLGQGGVANGIAIRGFTDAEHGRDVAYFIDGIPINEVSSIHTPNYADLNILIPETVERLEVIRGPFSALYGDSNLGGAVNLVTKRFDTTGSAGASGGYFNTARGIVTYSRPRTEPGTIAPFLAFEGYTTDGYRDNQGYKRYNLFGKVTVPTRDGALSIRTQFYGGNWGAPGYLNRQQVASGVLSPQAAVNSSDGGNKDFQNVVLNYAHGDMDQALTFTGFFNHDVFVRFADFGAGQREQTEGRVTTGLTLRKVWTGTLFKAFPAQLMVGTNFRNDSVNANQAPTISRNVVGPYVKNLSFSEQGWGEYIQAQIKPVPWLKLTGGGRYDHFWYDINDRLATSSVPQSDTGVLSPKVGVAVTPVSWIELFANYGEGFRSPSAIDDLITTPNLKPLKLRSQEVGIQIQPTARLKFLADVWYTTLDREIFQPAPGLPPQNLGKSLREGYDIETRYYLQQDKQGQASLFVNYTQIRAVLRNQEPAVYVPNVPIYLVNVGTDVDLPVGGQDSPHRVNALLYAQFIGKKHITQDGAFSTTPYQRLAGRVAYAHRSGWMFFMDAIWYPNDRLSETAINIGPGTGATVADIVTNPQAPFAFIVGTTYRFRT
jgi:outer membrane receptor protein involved in Fe transport